MGDTDLDPRIIEHADDFLRHCRPFGLIPLPSEARKALIGMLELALLQGKKEGIRECREKMRART